MENKYVAVKGVEINFDFLQKRKYNILYKEELLRCIVKENILINQANQYFY